VRTCCTQQVLAGTLKKKTRFIRKFRWVRVQSHEEGVPNTVYEEMHKYFHHEEVVIVIYDFAPDPSKFPFLFYQCTVSFKNTVHTMDWPKMSIIMANGAKLLFATAQSIKILFFHVMRL
jgi:hypothetical protein